MLTQATLEQYLVLASKAPSAHNAQPWQVHYNIEQQLIEIYLNEANVPSVSDSTKRQSIISVGCFLANLMLILRDNDHSFKLHLNEFSTNETTYLAKLELLDGQSIQPSLPFELDKCLKKGLSSQILNRHNDRGAYAKEDIESRVNDVTGQYLAFCHSAGLHLTAAIDQKIINRLGELTAKAMSMIFALDSSREELKHFVASVEDENTTRKMQLRSLSLSTIGSVDRWLNSPETVQRESTFWKESIESGPAILCISGETDLRQDWLLVGIVLELLLLEFTALGYCHSIWASLVEIPPMVPLLKEALGVHSRPLALFRVGRPIAPMVRTSQRANITSFAKQMIL